MNKTTGTLASYLPTSSSITGVAFFALRYSFCDKWVVLREALCVRTAVTATEFFSLKTRSYFWP